MKKSNLLTYGRRLNDIGRVVVEAVYAAGGSDEDAERIFGEVLQGQIGQLVMGKLLLAKPSGLLTIYDQSLGLMELIRRAVGSDNLDNINSNITPERFPLHGNGVRSVNLRVEPFLDGETGEQAAKRLTSAGHILADTGDLAGFQYDHPKEVAKFTWVVALAKSARWTSPDGGVGVPFADVDGSCRDFDLGNFCDYFDSADGVLVRCE